MVEVAMIKLLEQIATDDEERRDIGTLAIRAIFGELSTGSQAAGAIVDKAVSSVIKLLGNVSPGLVRHAACPG